MTIVRKVQDSWNSRDLKGVTGTLNLSDKCQPQPNQYFNCSETSTSYPYRVYNKVLTELHHSEVLEVTEQVALH